MVEEESASVGKIKPLSFPLIYNFISRTSLATFGDLQVKIGSWIVSTLATIQRKREFINRLEWIASEYCQNLKGDIIFLVKHYFDFKKALST
jgi:hypothetical protein